MVYEPRPIDTSAVALPEELLRLTERLAEHAHDTWAQQRLSDGWRLGPRRDDARKEHPSLVPYAELPEAEKEYDRATALGTLRAILAQGYHIQVPAPAADEHRVQLLRRVLDPAADLAALLAVWQGRSEQEAPWTHSPELHSQLGERLLRAGAPFLAAEVVRDGLSRWPSDVRLRQLHGLALARSGATEDANKLLGELRAAGHADEETLGLLGRTHKDLGLRAADAAERQRHLRLARDAYAEAFQRHDGYWTGINAATLARLLGEPERSRTLARQVRDLCRRELEKTKPGDPYWALATLGEAALNLEEWAEAERWYRQAAAACRQRFGDLNSTRKQARLLLACLGRPPALIDQWLPMPSVVMFVGHMMDHPRRQRERFPVRLEAAVSGRIRDWLRAQNALLGYASAACGSDLLFLEAILELGGEANVVLPYDRKAFAHDSVDIIKGADWGRRFDDVLARAQVVQASGEKVAGGVSYDYANLVLHGLAGVRAGELETPHLALAVWDGQPGDGPGGTAATVRRWQGLGLPVARIHLAAGAPELRIVSEPPLPAPVELDAAADGEETRVMALLFADAVNYSQLTEEQVPRFVQHYLGGVAELLRRSPSGAVVRQTWGDGLYLVFRGVEEAGAFALDLCELVTGTRWADKGLPAGLSLRVALHAGPVYGCREPVTDTWTYTGTHVSRAARIEPITPPGQVYASQAFAALAAVEGVRGFTCEYVKQVAWAKRYGTFPTYLVRRTR
jgi:class 3 adenylate cyclase